jgi:WD40 repeat protein
MIWSIIGEPVIGIKVRKKNLSSLAFSPDGRILATSGLGDNIQLWSLPQGKLINTLRGHQIAVWSLTFIDEGRLLVSFGYEQVIKVWDVASGQEVRSIELENGTARGFTFTPDQRKFALLQEGRAELWSAIEWQPLLEYTGEPRL